MKSRLPIVVLALALVAIMAVPAGAQSEHERVATVRVTVSEFINFTIFDYGTVGLNWSDIPPGDTNVPEDADPNFGSVYLILGSDTNVPVALSLTGAGDFTSPGVADTIPLGNARYSVANDLAQSSPMSTADAVLSPTIPAGEAWATRVWHWLSVPADVPSGTYSTSFFYKAEKVQ